MGFIYSKLKHYTIPRVDFQTSKSLNTDIPQTISPTPIDRPIYGIRFRYQKESRPRKKWPPESSEKKRLLQAVPLETPQGNHYSIERASVIFWMLVFGSIFTSSAPKPIKCHKQWWNDVLQPSVVKIMNFCLEWNLPTQMRFSVIMPGFNCDFLEFLVGKVFQTISLISYVFLA